MVFQDCGAGAWGWGRKPWPADEGVIVLTFEPRFLDEGCGQIGLGKVVLNLYYYFLKKSTFCFPLEKLTARQSS